MRNATAIALFGALGALARYGMDAGVSKLLPGRFPWGIVLINLVGSFAIGVLYAVLVEARPHITEWIRTGLTTGFVGAFTTFSTFSIISVRFIEEGTPGLAAVNVVISVGFGALAAWGGLLIGRAAV